MYTIKRAVNTEKLFSRADDIKKLVGQSEKLCKEFIKCMEMYDTTYLKHWIDGIYSCIKQANDLNMPYGLVFARLSNKFKSTEDVKKLIGNDHGKSFVKSVKTDLVNKRDYDFYIGSVKDYKYSDEEYTRYLSILYLAVMNEVDVDDIDLGSIWNNEFNDITVDATSTTKGIPSSSIKKVVTRFIFHLNGDYGEVLSNSQYIK